MPLHAVCSTVRPASFLYGSGGGYGSQSPICFPRRVFSIFAHTQLRTETDVQLARTEFKANQIEQTVDGYSGPNAAQNLWGQTGIASTLYPVTLPAYRETTYG